MGIKDLEDLKKLSILRSQIDGISVEEILITEFPTVGSEDNVTDALNKIKQSGFQDIPVVDNGAYVAMVSYGVILKKKNIPAETKVRTIMRNLPTLDMETDMTKIAEHMISNGCRQLPVLNGKKVVGLISRRGLMGIAARMKGLKDIKVWEIMTTPVEFIRDNALITDAVEKMRRLDIRTIPVMDSADNLVGVVGMREIIDNFWKEGSKEFGDITKHSKAQITIESVCTTHVETVAWDCDMDKAAALMEERRYSTMPVMDGKEMVGILTEYDIIELLSSCREREALFVQISGLDDEDKTYTAAMYKDIETEVVKISRIYKPESLTIHVARYNDEGERKKYSLSGKMFVNGMTFNAKTVDWDLVRANNDLIKKISDMILEKKDSRVTFRKRKK